MIKSHENKGSLVLQVGSHVTHTMQKGIVDSAAFQHNPSLLFCGMLASLASSGTWLQASGSLCFICSHRDVRIGILTLDTKPCFEGLNDIAQARNSLVLIGRASMPLSFKNAFEF